MNTSPGGWQGYPQAGNPQWGYTPSSMTGQNTFGQNGGNMAIQQPEAPFVGRYINRVEEIMPREVPMDGRIGIFPTQTLEEIYLKAWDRNGTIKTFRYILDPMQNLNQSNNMVQGADIGSQILERLDELEQKFTDAQQPRSTNRRNNSKGGEDNGST